MNMRKTLEDLANCIADASFYWNGEDENRYKFLKKARCLAFDVLRELKIEDDKQIK